MFFKIVLLFVVTPIVLTPLFNYIFGEKKRRVRFAADEVKVYHLSKSERKMKKDAYKRISISSRHYRKMDTLCWFMDNLSIN